MRTLTIRVPSARAVALALAACLALLLVLTACEGDKGPSAQKRESKSQQQSYEQAVAGDPAHSCKGCPTRKTINFWIDTWSSPNKLAYVYLQNSEGQVTGYYVFKGLPVSYCASLTPTYQLIDTPNDGSNARDQQVPAPSVDGVYYGGAGSCNTYYGRDATTDAYIEYTAGLGINVLLYDRPLAGSTAGDAKPLGPTSVEDVS